MILEYKRLHVKPAELDSRPFILDLSSLLFLHGRAGGLRKSSCLVLRCRVL